MQDDIITAVHQAINVRPCPLCGNQGRWAISPSIHLLASYDPVDDSVTPQKGLPVTSATCQTCGFVVTLDAIRLGLVKAN